MCYAEVLIYCTVYHIIGLLLLMDECFTAVAGQGGANLNNFFIFLVGLTCKNALYLLR